MLTVQEMAMITEDRLNGNALRVAGPEAEAFLESIDRDLALAEKEGYSIDIPAEWEVGEDE